MLVSAALASTVYPKRKKPKDPETGQQPCAPQCSAELLPAAGPPDIDRFQPFPSIAAEFSGMIPKIVFNACLSPC